MVPKWNDSSLENTEWMLLLTLVTIYVALYFPPCELRNNSLFSSISLYFEREQKVCGEEERQDQSTER